MKVLAHLIIWLVFILLLPTHTVSKKVHDDNTNVIQISANNFEDVRADPSLSVRASYLEKHYQQKSFVGYSDRFVTSSTFGNLNAPDDILVKVIFKTPLTNKKRKSLLQKLKNSGLNIHARHRYAVEGFLSYKNLRKVSSLPEVRYLDVEPLPVGRQSVNITGLEIAKALGLMPDTRTGLNLTGLGVKIGVLSVSYGTNLGSLYNSKLRKLVPDVKVLSDLSTACTGKSSDCDEGRALIEVLYSISPGSNYTFSTAYLGSYKFSLDIQFMASLGCKVLVDDVGYINEPVFEDGMVAKAVTKVTTAPYNALYFSAAGNTAGQSYLTTFIPSDIKLSYQKQSADGTPRSITVSVHSFTPEAPCVTLRVAKGTPLTIALQWAEPFASLGGSGAVTDLDLVIVGDPAEGITSPQPENNLGRDPVEIDFITPSLDTTIRIYVANSNNNLAPKFWLFISPCCFSADSIKPFPQGPTIFGHPNSPNAISIGAAGYKTTPKLGTTPPVIEPFSSIGGLPVYVRSDNQLVSPENRFKPDFIGPDGAFTSFFGKPTATNSYYQFFGTSASAPAIAGVAALYLQKYPNLHRDQLIEAWKTSAYPFAGQNRGSYSPVSGYGLIDGYGGYLQLISIMNRQVPPPPVSPVPPSPISPSPVSPSSSPKKTKKALTPSQLKQRRKRQRRKRRRLARAKAKAAAKK